MVLRRLPLIEARRPRPPWAAAGLRIPPPAPQHAARLVPTPLLIPAAARLHRTQAALTIPPRSLLPRATAAPPVRFPPLRAVVHPFPRIARYRTSKILISAALRRLGQLG